MYNFCFKKKIESYIYDFLKVKINNDVLQFLTCRTHVCVFDSMNSMITMIYDLNHYSVLNRKLIFKLW